MDGKWKSRDGTVVNKPGTQWLYSNFNTYMISCAIEKRAGVNLLEYLRLVLTVQ